MTNGDDSAALGAAAAAQKLYNPDTVANKGNGANGGSVNADGTINGDPAASVTTYLVAYGTGASKSRSDWIAWGGSGMKRTFGTFSGADTWTTIPTQAERDACKTCIDSFLAPDPDTLKDVLTKVINQGASSGEFSAQQSLTDSIFELAGDAPIGTAPAPWSPFNPRNRYDPLVPVRFVSTFTLPLFTGQIKAYTNDGPDSLATTGANCLVGNACRRWSANDKLVARVSAGMAAACVVSAPAGVAAGQCPFSFLWNGADITNVGSRAGVGIRRRIFTTSRNGVFGPTVDELIAGTSPSRVALWPPQTSGVPVAPASDTAQGLFDAELGLPLDTAPSIDAAFLDLRTKFKACMGTNLPANCPSMATTSGFTLGQLQRARREARETLLAFVAGAGFVADASGNPQRVAATAGGYTNKDILYATKTSILAESTLATPAVIGPPQPEEPEGTPWKPEYVLYRDGPRDHTDATKEPDGVSSFTGSMIRSGFGLRNPDTDGNNTSIGTVLGRIFYANDGRVMKPVMSVLYAGSNLALHAFRAGPNVATNITTACNDTSPFDGTDCGGEELWAYVPYDQLGKLLGRYVNNPQKRDPHDYVIARAIRFSDIFVPTPGTAVDPDDTPVAKTVAGISLGQIKGVWRKVMFVGRGKGGKYLTAIDVTAPGMFTETALSDSIVGPVIPLEPRQPRHDEREGRRPGFEPNRSERPRQLRDHGRDLVGARRGLRRPQHDARRRRHQEGDRHPAQAEGQRLRALRRLWLRCDRRGHELLQHRPADRRHHHARRRRRVRGGQLPDAQPHRHGVRQRDRGEPGRVQRVALPLRGGRRQVAERRGRAWPPRLRRRPLGPAVEVPDGRSRQAAPGCRPRRQPAGRDGELAARPARRTTPRPSPTST